MIAPERADETKRPPRFGSTLQPFERGGLAAAGASVGGICTRERLAFGINHPRVDNCFAESSLGVEQSGQAGVASEGLFGVARALGQGNSHLFEDFAGNALAGIAQVG